MSARVACLHHLKQPGHGHLGLALERAGVTRIDVDIRRGEALPALGQVDAIIALGGEQSVRDIDALPWMRAEAELLLAAVEREVPVLGICLGSQLLARALGAEVRRVERPFIGWRMLEPTAAGRRDRLVAAVDAPVLALHWNEDCHALPSGAEELLTGDGEGVEAFRAGACAWGMQFHPEVDAPILDQWYAADYQELERAGIGEAEARTADARHAAGQLAQAERLFRSFTELVATRAAA
jgi:GMP synthase (glutamine-hydrolysing)